MGMSIDKAIEHGKEQLEIFGGEHKEFIECAIDTMCKYQKIEELIEYHMLRTLPKKNMSGFQKDILEVIDNGNDD
jgi:hypothetical protein